MEKFIRSKKFQLKEFIFESKSLQFILGLSAIIMGIGLYPFKQTKLYSVRCICWAGRVINIKFIETISFFFIGKCLLKKPKKNGNGTILSETCFSSQFLLKSASIYSTNGVSGKVSLFRDLIVLKKRSASEKGVLLIKYTPAFDAFYYHFDFDRMSKDYYFILEPSWAGACDPSFLIFWRNSAHKNVIVQAIEQKDYNFIKKLNGNFIPIDIGSSDWTDPDVFTFNNSSNKIYDLIMVSNWGLHKKHEKLFKALETIEKNLTVLLIGFPWSGRTKRDIEAEIKQFRLAHIGFEIKENIPAKEVSMLLNKSKVFLLLSRKEGGNKSIIESFFVNVPAILYKNFIGGVQARINKNTGIFTSYADLAKNIEYMVENYEQFSPREWIEKNSGSRVSTLKLNNLLKHLSIQNGEVWNGDIMEKVNAPNLLYKSGENNFQGNEHAFDLYKRSSH